MEEEYFLEDIAEMAISNQREFLDVEGQKVREEHNFEEKINYFGEVIGHLDERIPAEMKNLLDLLGAIVDKIKEIGDIVSEYGARTLKIIKDEEKIIQKLQGDVKHKEWKFVKEHANEGSDYEAKLVKLEKRELKLLHHKFIEIMKIIKKDGLINAIDEDLTKYKGKDEYRDKIEYYFIHIYKIIRAYERIFRDLWEKERKLSKVKV